MKGKELLSFDVKKMNPEAKQYSVTRNNLDRLVVPPIGSREAKESQKYVSDWWWISPTILQTGKWRKMRSSSSPPITILLLLILIPKISVCSSMSSADAAAASPGSISDAWTPNDHLQDERLSKKRSRLLLKKTNNRKLKLKIGDAITPHSMTKTQEHNAAQMNSIDSISGQHLNRHFHVWPCLFS